MRPTGDAVTSTSVALIRFNQVSIMPLRLIFLLHFLAQTSQTSCLSLVRS